MTKQEMANRIDELENQVYNLTWYLKYIQANCPEAWRYLEAYFSGMGGYSEWGND